MFTPILTGGTEPIGFLKTYFYQDFYQSQVIFLVDLIHP
jgi:hypothetical protein